jgi:cytochrome c oxidase cbb3-type subunit 3
MKRITILKKTIGLLSFMLSTSIVFAAETTTHLSTSSTPDNTIKYSLIGLVLILLLIIGAMGNVVISLSKVYSQKLKAGKNKAMSIIGFGLILLASNAMAQEAPTTANIVGNELINGMQADTYYFLMGIIGFELFILLSLLFIIQVLIKTIRRDETKVEALKKAIRIPFWDKLNNSVAIEKEKDILLDHDYDGIKELDNSLPPWWKYGFYLTILVSVIYLYYYHAGGNGPSSIDEFNTEVAEGNAAVAAYLATAADKVDENTITISTDANVIATGKNLFETNCAACHAKDGGGGVGPNLTDAFWLHQGDIKSIFKSIKYGWKEKGMKSWKEDFSAKQIAALASYVCTLKGTKPLAPKDPQGVEETNSTTANSDTTKTN